MKKTSVRLLVCALIVMSVALTGCSSDSDSTKTDDKKADTENTTANSDLDLFSDASVTKAPKEGAKFGNGQVLTFEYDGSKSDNDEYATLSYQLSYVQDDGALIPMGGASLEGKGSGTFKTTDSVFTSNADGKQGVFELTVTYGSGIDDSGKITGTNTVLGRYLVNIEVAE